MHHNFLLRASSSILLYIFVLFYILFSCSSQFIFDSFHHQYMSYSSCNCAAVQHSSEVLLFAATSFEESVYVLIVPLQTENNDDKRRCADPRHFPVPTCINNSHQRISAQQQSFNWPHTYSGTFTTDSVRGAFLATSLDPLFSSETSFEQLLTDSYSTSYDSFIFFSQHSTARQL